MGKKAEKDKKIDIEIKDEKSAETVEKPESQDIKEQPEVEEIKEEEETKADEKSDEQIIAEYEEKIQKLEDRFLRLAAEFENYKKRTARQFEEIIRNSNGKIIAQILEVVDNFERALESTSKATDFKSLREGTELIYQHLFNILDREGVEPIKAVGEKFDPNLHEAMMQVESDEYPEGIVTREISRGYKLKGKVIRFSRVAVSNGKIEVEKEKGDESDKTESN